MSQWWSIKNPTERAEAKRRYYEIVDGRWTPQNEPDVYGVQRAVLGDRKAYISVHGAFEFGAKSALSKAEAHALAAGKQPRRRKRPTKKESNELHKKVTPVHPIDQHRDHQR